MNTNDFYELKKSYDTSQMPEKERKNESGESREEEQTQ